MFIDPVKAVCACPRPGGTDRGMVIDGDAEHALQAVGQTAVLDNEKQTSATVLRARTFACKGSLLVQITEDRIVLVAPGGDAKIRMVGICGCSTLQVESFSSPGTAVRGFHHAGPSEILGPASDGGIGHGGRHIRRGEPCGGLKRDASKKCR